jgi:GNAT superfamily N-acetyltransferase
MEIRPAEASEIRALARLWYDGWQDAHAGIVPETLRHARTVQSFAERLEAGLGDVRVACPVGAPLGFCMLRGNELYQLFVTAEARGAGVAAALMADAESRLSRSGAATTWLDCAIGNERAARFYEKSGWRWTGTVVSRLGLPTGPFDLEVWRYEKRLSAPESG